MNATPRRRTPRDLARTGRSSGPLAWAVACCVVIVALTLGCGQLAYRLTTPAPTRFMPNPMELPLVADDFVWEQIIDVVDDYFRVAKEQPVQNNRQLVLDGRLETGYRVGSSLFEPWRKDSTAGFERLQSTLQSIRRRAIITLRPIPTGYVIEVVVQKDLEDTDRPQFATETSAGLRHDGTLIRDNDRYQEGQQTLGWIPLGRDQSLEQVILSDIFGRVTRPDTH